MTKKDTITITFDPVKRELVITNSNHSLTVDNFLTGSDGVHVRTLDIEAQKQVIRHIIPNVLK